MRKAILFLFTVFLVIQCASSQTNIITGDPTSDLPKLLLEKTFTADIMDGVKSNPRQLSLGLKFQRGIQENNAWFLEYMQTAKPGKGLNYHPNFGMSEQEYNELGELIKQLEISSTCQEKLQILKSDTLISFYANGKLIIYNQVKIDLKRNQIIYKDYVLSFASKVNVTDQNNGFRSKWNGYNWVFEYPSNIENVDFSNLEKLNSCKIYSWST